MAQETKIVSMLDYIQKHTSSQYLKDIIQEIDSMSKSSDKIANEQSTVRLFLEDPSRPKFLKPKLRQKNDPTPPWNYPGSTIEPLV